MESRDIEAIEKAHANATIDELYEECQRYYRHRHKSDAARETLEILQRLLEQRLAEDEPSPSEWSKANPEKPKPLTPAELKRREEKRLERITQGGRYLPPPKMEPSMTQSRWDQQQNLMRAHLPFKGVHSCPDCREGYRAPSCTSHCEQAGWFQAKRATYAETLAYEARRAEKQ